MLRPDIELPFECSWGFTTRQDEPLTFRPLGLCQVHGPRVICAHEYKGDPPENADGLWTMKSGQLIGVRVADCVPILLAGLAQGRPWVAALHGGWRGVVKGILREGVRAFIDQGGKSSDLYYAFGPSIQACCFEVGPEVVAECQKDLAFDPSLAKIQADGKAMLDLHGFLRRQALAEGLASGKDGSIKLCTKCHPGTFYSYRGGDREARQWGWVQL